MGRYKHKIGLKNIHSRETDRTRKRQMKMEMTAKNEKTKAGVRDSDTQTLSHKYAQRHVLAHYCMCSKGERQFILCNYSVSHWIAASPSVH